MAQHAAWVAEHWPTKPFIISETGAGGIVGNHSDNQTVPARWSEEYQVVVDRLDASTAMDCSNVSGLALWQLMDIKVDSANNSMSIQFTKAVTAINSRISRAKLRCQNGTEWFDARLQEREAIKKDS